MIAVLREPRTPVMLQGFVAPQAAMLYERCRVVFVGSSIVRPSSSAGHVQAGGAVYPVPACRSLLLLALRCELSIAQRCSSA